MTKVQTRKDGSYTISFLDIFGSNRTRIGDQITVQVATATNINESLAEVTYTVTSTAISNLETKLDIQLPTEQNPTLTKEELETDTFTITGVLKMASGQPVGNGYHVIGQNPRVKSGWFLPPQSDTRSDGSFALSFLDIFGSRRTKIDDQIVLQAIDNNTGQVVAKMTYFVTLQAIKNLAVKIDLFLTNLETTNQSDINLQLDNSGIKADGLSQTILTVTIRGGNSNLLSNTLTITAIKGTISQLNKTETGVYTAIYTAPNLSILQPTTDTITVKSSELNFQTVQSLTLQPTVKDLELPLVKDGPIPTTENISWDINKNQLVDIYDLVPVIQQWGKKTTEFNMIGDINRDGIVEAADARLVVEHFGQSTGKPKAVENSNLEMKFPISPYLNPSSLNPQVGELLNVQVDIHVPFDFAKQISGFEGKLNYDSAQLELVEMSMATQFFPAAWYTSNNSEHPTPLSPSKLGPLFQTGSVMFAAAGFPRAKTLALGKTVVIFTFKILARSRSRLSISDFKLADQRGRSISTQTSFIDLFPWDLNSDGLINLQDLGTMRHEWQKNERGLVSDLNRDNLVDNFDYQILIGHLDPSIHFPVEQTSKSVSLTLQPSVIKLPKVGQKLTIQVLSDSVTKLIAYQSTLTYAPDQLQFTGIDLHLFDPNQLGFPTSSANEQLGAKTASNSDALDWVKQGSITFTKAEMSTISDYTFDKNSILANLTFIVKSRQDTTLSLTSVAAVDNTNQLLKINPSSLELRRPVTKDVPVDQIEFLLDNHYLLANGHITTNLKLHLIDQHSSFISGETVFLESSNGQISNIATDNGDGTYTGYYTAKIDQPQTAEITASTSNGTIEKLTLHFFHLVELSTSTPQISAKPSARAKIIVTIRNDIGQPQKDQEVNLTAQGGEIKSPATDNGDGTYTTYYTTNTDQIGTVQITASIPSGASDKLSIQLIPIRISPQRSTLKLIGESTLPLTHLTMVEVELLTLDGLPVVGRNVALDIEPSSKIRIEQSKKTDINGKTQIAFTVGDPGVKVVKAVVDNLTLGDGLAFLFTGQLQLGDVDLDGEVTIFDLVFTASQFGEKGPNLAGDVNQDGQVDIFDLSLVAVDLMRNHQPEIAAPVQIANLADQKWLSTLNLSVFEKKRIRLAIQELHHLLAPTTAENLAIQILKAVMLPNQTQLFTNFPNPFNPETWIPFELAKNSPVQLVIYDASGAIVRQINCGNLAAGRYLSKQRAIYWNGQTEAGNLVSSGIYFYQLQTADYIRSKKMVVLK